MNERKPFDPKRIKKRESGQPARRERYRNGTGEQGGFNWDPSDENNTPSTSPTSHDQQQNKSTPRPLSVTELSNLIKDVVSQHTPKKITVAGEISNFVNRNHWYLSLKDETSVLSCVMWASSARKCNFEPEHGQQVVARGRLDYYGPQGRLQFYIDKLEPVGQGALEIAFRKLCEKLRAKGYFDHDQKQPLPDFPRKVAVVTSSTSAALQDVIKTTHQRYPGCQLYLFDARMQGAESAPQVAQAIQWLNTVAEKTGIEAIILTRGGGSLEDLWAFNEEVVAEAIHHSNLPIVAAIGHETDTTIAELVADVRCSTPTQAAMCLIPDALEWEHRLEQYARRLKGGIRSVYSQAKARLDTAQRFNLFYEPRSFVREYARDIDDLQARLMEGIKERIRDEHQRLQEHERMLVRVEPVNALRLGRQRIDDIERRLKVGQQHLQEKSTTRLKDIARDLPLAIARSLKEAERTLTGLEREMKAISPRRVLQRGYSYTTNADGKVIRSSKRVKVGDLMITHMADGRVHGQAIKISDQCIIPDQALPEVKGKTRRKKKDTDTGNNPGLFD